MSSPLQNPQTNPQVPNTEIITQSHFCNRMTSGKINSWMSTQTYPALAKLLQKVMTFFEKIISAVWLGSLTLLLYFAKGRPNT